MKSKRTKIWKRIVAILLVLSVVITDSSLWSITALADENDPPTTVTCNFNCTLPNGTSIQGVTYTVQQEVAITNDDGTTGTKMENLNPDDGKWTLTIGQKYKIIAQHGGFVNEIVTNEYTPAAGDAATYTFSVAWGDLKISMQNQTMTRTATLDVPTENGWGLEWNWSSSDTSVASIETETEDGKKMIKIKANKAGTATITRTYKIDDNNQLQSSMTLNVEPQIVKANIKFYIKDKDGQDVDVTSSIPYYNITKDGSTVAATDGKYDLTENEVYTYTICKEKEEDSDPTGLNKYTDSFTVPEKTAADSQDVGINLDVSMPTFAINDAALGNHIASVKRNCELDIKCNNTDKLLDGWRYKIIYDGADEGITDEEEREISAGCNDIKCACDAFRIQCIYGGKVIKEYTVNTFKDYTVEARYDKRTLKNVTISAKLDNEDVSELKSGNEYDITVSGTGIKAKTVKEKIYFYKSNYTIELTSEDLTAPQIKLENNSTLVGTTGGTISLSNVTVENHLVDDNIKWTWKCVKKDESKKELAINTTDNCIDLKDAEPGEYELTYSFDGVTSNALAVKVNAVKLNVNWDKFQGAYKYYDGTNIFRIEMNIGEDDAVTVEEGEKKDYAIEAEDILVIEGTVSDAIPGTYAIINVGKAYIKNEDRKVWYNVDNIQTGAIMVGTLPDDDTRGKLEIRKAEIMVNFVTDSIALEYRTNQISYMGNSLNVEFEVLSSNGNAVDSTGIGINKSEMLHLLYEAMGETSLRKTTGVSFAGVKYTQPDENGQGEQAYVYAGENGNQYITFYFREEDYEALSESGESVVGTTNKQVFFDYDQTKETIENLDVSNFILSQEQVRNGSTKEIKLLSGSWCVYNKDIIGTMNQDSEYFTADIKEEGYNAIAFYPLDVKEDGIAFPNSIIKEQVQKNINIAETISEVQYYAMVFTRKSSTGIDITFDFATEVAVIRVIPEDMGEGTYETKIAGFNYPIINLYLDNTAPSVTYDDDKIDRGNEKDIIWHTGQIKKDITFTVENTGFPVFKVEYGLLDIEDIGGEWENKLNEDWDTEASCLPVSDWSALIEYKPITVTGEGKYTISCPQDGDYILFVRITNEAGILGEYISNAFIVDTVPPIVSGDFYDEDNKDISDKISDGETYYVSTNELKAAIIIEEANLTSCEVTVKATDKEGASIPELDEDELAEQIKDTLIEDEQENNSGGVREHRWEGSLDKDANYRINVQATDLAGNYAVSEAEHKAGVKNGVEGKGVTFVFTIDDEYPIGSISLDGQIKKIESIEDGVIKTVFDDIVDKWNGLVEYFTYNVFSNEKIGYTFTSDDRISGCTASYYIADDVMTVDQLNALTETDWISCENNQREEIDKGKKNCIYQKVVDKAGNVTYIGTNGIITDGQAPHININPTMEANDNAFYNKDVPVDVKVEDVMGEAEMAVSGIQAVTYSITSDSEDESVIELNRSDNKDKDLTEYEIEDLVIDAEKYNNNQVVLSVTTIDNAGNEETETKEFKIDTVKPEITVTYDDEQGNDYYNHTRTATITIKERNLDTKDVDITVKSEHGSKAAIGKWTHTDNIKTSDDATYTCKVTFDKDDDYEFSVDCVDMAGNKAKKSFADKFTVDKTNPVIEVSYSNGQVEENAYYNEAVTATITIDEHNFNAEKADIQIQTESGSSVGVSAFRGNGDSHSASVVFDRDDVYSINVSYIDEAGNEGNTYQGNTFHIDLKNPEIEITNVKDKSANKDDVSPVIVCTDENYDENKVTISVYGANGGEISLDKLGVSSRAVANGEEFTLNFPKEEAMDDVYTLTAKMEDKAGNENEDSIQFSVNRYGSVYTLGTETGEWLTGGVCSYIKEGKKVVIIETNVDEVVERNISYTMGAISAETVEVKQLENCSSEEKNKGTYFESKQISSENEWYQYQYTIDKKNFTKEGNYSIQIDSVDMAGNHTSNASNRHEKGKLEILFAIDQTAPSAVVSGTQNDAIYNEESHTVLLDVQDNLALDTVSVYLNDKEYATYDAKEISELEDGMIPVVVEESIATQTIQLKATDMAGNVLSKDSTGEYDKVFEDFNIIVTQNIIVQMVHTFWFYIALGLSAVGILVVVIIVKRKKKQ